MDIYSVIDAAKEAAGGLASASSAAKNLKDFFRREKGAPPEMQALILDLYNALIDAKHAQATIEDMLAELQRELHDRDEFEAELARYALTDTGRGAVVYTLKPDDDKGEPPHSICPSCAAKRKKSILQPDPENLNFLKCPACPARFLRINPEGCGIMIAPVRSRGTW